MSANDDDRDGDGGEDAQLKQLRAVWVTMRDEDPPEGGLAALMAAARDKAGEMAAPEQAAPGESWWHRALAVLRRPPVLALATVTVLLGGALMISQRGERVTAESTATETQERPREAATDHAGPAANAPPSEVAAGSGSSVTNSAAQPGSAVVPAAAAAAPAATPFEKPAPPANLAAPSRPRPRPTPRTEGGREDSGRTKQSADKPSESEAIGGAAGISNDGENSAAPAPVSRPEIDATSTTRAPVRKAPAPAMPAPATETVEPRLSKDEADGPSARAARLTQLVKQCESAAARNDCAAVKLLAKQILSTDVAAYKQRIVTNSSIARCLN